MRLRTPFVSLAAATLLAACGGATEDSPPAGEPTETGAPDDDVAEDADTALSEAVDLAIEDAAADRGAVEDEIEVVSFEEVTWPDESLGCADLEPTDGNPVEGYFVHLNVAGEEMLYHGESDEPPFHCEEPLTDDRG